MSIILASGSPRRSQILTEAGFNFKVIKPDVDESFDNDFPVKEVPLFLANKKMLTAKTMCSPDDIIITADTVVILNNAIIGKPLDKQEATKILHELSGKIHEVISGVCIAKGDKQYDIEVATKVHFADVTAKEINFYLDTYKPYDKAGAYAIQEWIGINKILRIEGDYYNVVGFPMSKIFPILNALV